MNSLCALLAEHQAELDRTLLARMAAAGTPRGWESEVAVSPLGRAGLGSSRWGDRDPARDGSPRGGHGDLPIVADVRLDNRSELISRLGLGAADAPCDRQLLLAAYRRWGAGCTTHLLGDYAFAIWDSERARLFCARDEMGIKPLVWARIGATICVASRARQIALHPDLDRTLDEAYLGRYLAASLQPPEATPLRAIRNLPPAHCLIAENGRVETRATWQPDPQARLRYRDPDEYVEQFLELLRRSVRARLRGCGAAVGIQLSGGIDSGAVAAMVHEQTAEIEPPPRRLALSARFESVPDCDEGPWIREVAARLELETHSFFPERTGILEPAERFDFELDSPFVGWVGVEGAMLERLAAAGGRVILTGHGGDSILYGSPMLYADLLRQGRLPSLTRDLLEHSKRSRVPLWRLAYLYLAKPLLPAGLLSAGRRLAGRGRSRRPPSWLTPRIVAAAGLDAAVERLDRIVARGGARETLARQASYLGDVSIGLDWLERLGARFGIEARHPLLDRRIAEFAVAVPPEIHYRAGLGKRLLRAAMKDRLPDSVRRRRAKTLFRPFVDHCFRERERERLQELVREPLLGAIGAVDVDRLQSVMNRYLQGNDPAFAVYAQRVATLERWLRLLFNGPRESGSAAADNSGLPVPAGGVVE